MTFPLVHLNGTAGDDLLEGVLKSVAAICTAQGVLRETAPHARDYYPQGPGKWAAAHDEHIARLAKLDTIKRELDAMAEDICRQQDAREARRK